MTSNMDQRPPGSSVPEAGKETAPADPQPAAEIAPPSDPLSRLEAELEAARADIEQWRDRLLRKAAELENFRKRTEKERGETAVFAKSAVLLEILPVVDGFERALASLDSCANPEEGLAQHREGVQLLYKQLLNTLTRLGVTPLATVGQAFDPHHHEALARVASGEYAENTVVAELRKGYLFNDRLLRPAQVTVSAGLRGENRSES